MNKAEVTLRQLELCFLQIGKMDEAKKILSEYAQQVRDNKCNDCFHTFQKKGTQGYHDVEEFYLYPDDN